jgi:hypothetical protein
MRAYELIEDYDLEKYLLDEPTRRPGTRSPVLTLHHVNKLKQMKASRRAEHNAKQALWQMMYGHDEVRERDLDRREADLEAREHELRLREIEAGIDKAIADAEADEKSKQHLHTMAMREIDRREKKKA